MSFGLQSTRRKILSQVVAGVDGYELKNGIEKYTTAIDVTGSATIAPMGIPVVYNGTEFEIFLDQDISAVTGDSPLVNGYPVAIVIGKEYIGSNFEDVTLSGTAISLTALVRGDADVLYSGVDFGAASAPNIALFKAAMEAQGVTAVAEAAVVTPSYTA